MAKQTVKVFFVLFLSIMLFACSGGKDLELEVKVRMDGNPVAKAKILVDGVEEGTTDDDGHFSKVIKRKPGTEVALSVAKKSEGYRIEPHEESFIVKVPEKGAVDRYSFEVDLKATKYCTFVVTEKGKPVEGAAIKVKGKNIGKTDEKGEFVYNYKALPKKGVRVIVTKKGYARWDKTRKIAPGQSLEVALSRKAVISVAILTDEYGRTRGLQGAVVRINNKKVGKTNAKGMYTYVYKGKPGKKVRLTVSVPGYIPSEWEKTIVLKGRRTVKKFFYPTKPKPIRVGIYDYVNNTPDEDVTKALSRIKEAVNNNLFSYLIFREVQSDTLHEKMKETKLTLETITTKGWQGTGLIRTVDMIILGSVAKDEDGLTIETKVYASGGKLIFSQINTAKREKDIKKTAKAIVRNIIDRFPFEGTVVLVEDQLHYRINLGKYDYKIRKGMQFALMAPTTDKTGRIQGYRDIGILKVRKAKKTESALEILNIKEGENIAIGDKVVRLIYRQEEMKAAKKSFVLLAKGGLPPDVSPLSGVNVYLDNMWVGTTGSNGACAIPVRLRKSYDIVLYRHNYQRVSEEIRIEEDKEVKEFALTVNNSLFKVESQPSGSDVFIDGENIGETPLLEGKLVNFGFHTLKLSASGDYRDWEEVVEFNNKIEDRTGNNKIVFYKDYLRIGKRAEVNGDVDAAMEAYRSAERGHPDYSNARRKLARLYMDEKNDYDAAIREFENVLSLPENRQLIYKQFAVTYTNLGHAYYENGDHLIQKDREAAAQHFAKAIQNLQRAKQNTRFFPNLHYDEAVHDTYYYLALSYHKLYLVTRQSTILDSADLAWREYFDFFPNGLKGNSAFVQISESAEQYWTQIKDLM